jgi:hypothetical protein
MTPVRQKDVSEYQARIDAIDEPTMAWFAGWLCADGSIGFVDEHQRPRLSFALCDIDPLVRFSELFGNEIAGPLPASGLGKQPRYAWRVSGWKVPIILHRLMPWLSDRYTAKALKAIEYENRPPAYLKLNPTQVATIKAELAVGIHGVVKRLAQEFGVSKSLISAIKRGRIWSEHA